MYTLALVLFINLLLARHETCLRWVPEACERKTYNGPEI